MLGRLLCRLKTQSLEGALVVDVMREVGYLYTGPQWLTGTVCCPKVSFTGAGGEEGGKRLLEGREEKFLW